MSIGSGRLAGRTAIITGATAGIGEAVSRLFAAQGARVVLVARRREAGDRLVSQIGPHRAVFVPGDVADPHTPPRVVDTAVTKFGGIDILVNNAGMDFTGDLLAADITEARRVFDVNFFGALGLLQEAGRAMRGRGGSIVNVTSRAASVGLPSLGIYGASKGALLSLTRAAAIELAPFGIRVNAVSPGLTNTPLVRTWIDSQEDPPAFRERVAAAIPQRRLAEPEEVAAAILFLASDEAAHITGASIAVDGGYTAV
jgi:NAD(P)-dependent dehydrogenase (short-subunit alcohol dehydrogenase family)